jgi:hypothetical protein
MKILARQEFLYRSPFLMSYPSIINRPQLQTQISFPFSRGAFRSCGCEGKSNSLLNVLGSTKIGYRFAWNDGNEKYKHSKPKTPVYEFLDAHKI